MSDPAGAAVDVTVEKNEQQGQEQAEENKPEVKEDSHLISLAKKLGHKTKEDFDGPEEKWVDADEFVARRFEILSERFDRTSNKLKTVEQMLDSVSSHIGKVEKVAYERAIADLKKERREAIADGDVERVEALDGEIEKVANDIRAEAPKGEQAKEVPELFQKWADENKWFQQDEIMGRFAVAVSDQFVKDNPGKTDADMLAHVDAEVRKRFPEKFENGKRKNPPPVDTGGSGGSGGGKTFSRNDLNEEQKKVHDYYVKHGVMTSADYIKSLVDIGELGGKK